MCSIVTLYTFADAERPSADAAQDIAMQSAAANHERPQSLFGDAQAAAMLDPPTALQGKKLRLGKKVWL